MLKKSTSTIKAYGSIKPSTAPGVATKQWQPLAKSRPWSPWQFVGIFVWRNNEEFQLQALEVKLSVSKLTWLLDSTHLKNISQIGSFPQVGLKMKNIWNILKPPTSYGLRATCVKTLTGMHFSKVVLCAHSICVCWKQKLQISRANSFIYALLHINKSGKHKTFDKSGWMPMRPSDVCCLHLRRHTQWQCHSACLRVKVNQHFSAWELILNYKNCHQVIKKASLFQKDVALNWRKIKQSTGIFSPVIFAPTFLTIQVKV